MKYVVYHMMTARIVATCETSAGALRSMNSHNKKLEKAHANRSKPDLGPEDCYLCASEEEYENNVNTWTTTYNMMDPDRKPIPIRRAQKGGCCDPATETYHSM